MSLNDVWYVIVHRDSDEKRRRNLIYTCKYIKSLGLNVLVIEQDATPKIEELCKSINVKYAFIKNSGLFNRAWGFNCFKNFVVAKKVFLADNDIILDKNILYDTINALDIYDVVRPFNGYACYYDEDATQLLTNTNTKTHPNTFKLVNIHNLSGGVCSFCVDSFYNKLGGFDERFEGWGGEDDELHNHMLHVGVSIYSFSNVAVHLNHERNHNEGNWQPHYNKNVEYIHDGKRNENIVIGDPKRFDV